MPADATQCMHKVALQVVSHAGDYSGAHDTAQAYKT